MARAMRGVTQHHFFGVRRKAASALEKDMLRMRRAFLGPKAPGQEILFPELFRIQQETSN